MPAGAARLASFFDTVGAVFFKKGSFVTFDPDIASDLLLVDGLETITLVASSTVTVAGAKRGQVTTAQSPSVTGVSEPTEMVWLLPEVNLAGVTPRPGDSITGADQTVWTITSVSYSPLAQVWRVGSRKQR